MSSKITLPQIIINFDLTFPLPLPHLSGNFIFDSHFPLKTNLAFKTQRRKNEKEKNLSTADETLLRVGKPSRRTPSCGTVL